MHQTHHLELTVVDSPHVLDRIVSLCRVRRCAILALHFEAADRHRPGRVSLTVDAAARAVRLTTLRLAGTPGVLAVAVSGAGERAEVHTCGVADGAVAASGRP